ncbi:MAG: hypothetical protein ACI9GK_001749, partial [Devosia sp.]
SRGWVSGHTSISSVLMSKTWRGLAGELAIS